MEGLKRKARLFCATEWRPQASYRERNITEHTRNRNRPAMPSSLYESSGIALRSETGTRSGRLRIFLLSPANASGIKGQRLLNSTVHSDLGVRLRDAGASLGEVYRFISSLYFRGKLDYAERFKNPPRGVAGVQIITGAGLMLPETVVTLSDLRKISATSIDVKNSDYRLPLHSALQRLRELAGPETDIILLGSIATPKYVTPIREVFGERLLFPTDFLGRGDMSRGSMLLRCCAQGAELAYSPVETIVQPV
jgi:hypothetical protein